MKKSSHGPVPTKGTKQSESHGHSAPKNKGHSKPDSVAVTHKRGIHPPVTKHKFLRNKAEYC